MRRHPTATPRSRIRRTRRRGGPAISRVTCILGDLDLGGVSRVYSDLGAVLASRGVVARIIAPDGPMRREITERGIEWEPIDWNAPRLASAAHAEALLRPGEPSVIVGDPRSAHLLALAAARGPALCAMHSIPPLLDAWMGRRETDRLLRLAASLQRAGRLRTMTIGESYRIAYAQRLGHDAGPVAVLPPAIDGRSFPFVSDVPGLDRVLCLSRLSPEKRPSLRAAVRLVAARVERGHPCRLDVVGDGVWRADAERLCAERLPTGSFRFHGATDRPADVIRRAGVTVATGLTVLEAIATGSRVVHARSTPDDAGPVGPVMTLDRFADAAADAFGGDIAPSTPGDVWRDLEQVDDDARLRLREHVLTAHSPEAAADALLDAIARLGAVSPSPELQAIATQAAQFDDELAGNRQIADEIWAARTQLEAELERRLSRPARSARPPR